MSNTYEQIAGPLLVFLAKLEFEELTSQERVRLFSDFSSLVAPFSHPALGVQLVQSDEVGVNESAQISQDASFIFGRFEYEMSHDGLTTPITVRRSSISTPFVEIDDGYHSYAIKHDAYIRHALKGTCQSQCLMANWMLSVSMCAYFRRYLYCCIYKQQ